MLRALVGTGLVKFRNFTAEEDKRRYAHVRTCKGSAEKAAITRKFLPRKMEEYEARKAETDALTSKTMPSCLFDNEKIGRSEI